MTKFTPDQVTISELSRYNKEAIRLMTEAGWK
jgi:iron(III) transport system substrate-binding protein